MIRNEKRLQRFLCLLLDQEVTIQCTSTTILATRSYKAISTPVQASLEHTQVHRYFGTRKVPFFEMLPDADKQQYHFTI